MRLVAVLVGVLTLLATYPVAAAPPPEDPEPAAGMHCVTRVATPFVQNVMEAHWSPDSTRLALVWFTQIRSTRSVTGYREQEVVDTLDLRTGRLWPVGVGDEAEWSDTGAYLAYWGPNGDELRITRGDSVVARLVPTVPRVRWVGDSLLFIEKNTVRRWQDGTVDTIGVIARQYVPVYPRDDVYWSGDGTRFTITRYSTDGTRQRFLGDAASGDVAPLDLPDAARFIEWSPRGHTLLVRYLDRIEMQDPETGTKSVTLGSAPGNVTAWAPDGKTLLMGRVSPTMPGGDAFDAFRVWDSGAGPATATLPNLMGARVFSPDGRYFAGVVRTGADSTRLEIWRCGAAPTGARPDADASSRLAKLNTGPGRFMRPTAGEISQFLTPTHTGIDLATPFGDLIYADDDGVVTASEYVYPGGNRVCVTRGALESCFYHTSLPLVAVGESVKRGQPVALIGMSGLVTGPHTHWEVKLAGRVVSPLTL